ncbi:ATP-binding cassette sub-family C member 4-like [Diadema setosum]|uniref:ATP-binding cassette sub-family C member 4-like n=1 Tax=Diadema setosum TaxID=31175 RepID=UPI003B3BE62E
MPRTSYGAIPNGQTSEMPSPVDGQVPPRVQPNRLATANPLSKLFFCWASTIFRTASRNKTVVTSDLFECMPEDSSNVLGGRLSRNWKREEMKSKPSLTRAVIKTFGPIYFLYAILFIFEGGIRVGQPLLLKRVTQYFSSNCTVSLLQQRDAYLYAGGLGLSSFFLALVHGVNYFGIQRLGMQVRVALCTLVYKKTLRLSNSALRQTTAGQVNNLMTNDVNRFDQLFVFLHNVWLGPVLAAVVLVLLWLEIGVASLPGYGVMFFLIIVNPVLGKLFTTLRRKTAFFTDRRVAAMTEVITSMRVIKMYAWEKPFGELIKKIRIQEVQKIINASYPMALNVTLGVFGNRLMDIGMIVMYCLTTDEIHAASIIVIISYCNALKFTFMRMFPRAIQFGSESLVSLSRIQRYLLLEDKKPEAAVLGDDLICFEDAVVADNLTCSWKEEEDSLQLQNVSFRVKKKQLLAVVGPVASGKSSLLMAILKELPALRGSVWTRGRVAFASQQPWVFGGTVRDNITFGREFQEWKYGEIIRVCSLNKDLQQLPDGDMTMVGERGVTLSGGQKARINLARALYDDADIYLLDDPLSAVDSEVSRQIFENCIKEYLAKKVCILVTHQLQFLSGADQILVLKEGQMEAVGTLDELHEMGIPFSQLMMKADPEEDEEEDDDEDEAEEDAANDDDVPLGLVASGSFKKSGSFKRSGSFRKSGSFKQSGTKSKKATKTGQLFKEERTEKGGISVGTYVRYFWAGGNVLTLFLMVFFVLGAQLVYSLADYWVGFWGDWENSKGNKEVVNETYPDWLVNLNLTTNDSAGVYGGLVGGLMLFGIIRAFLTLRIMITASRNLHNLMFASVTRSPVLFFDTTPTGRIQNRFTKDIGTMDDQLPYNFFDFLQIALQILGTVFLIIAISPMTLVPAVILFIILIMLTKYSVIATTAVKRLDGTMRSPVFSHTTSSLHGLWTIRAYGKEVDFEKQFCVHQDRHSEAWFMYIATNRWFGLRLDLLVATFTSAIAITCIPLSSIPSSFVAKDPGQIGVILANCVALSGVFQFCVRQSTLVENQMTSVERVIEYTKLESEGPLEKPDAKPPPGWPAKGAITLEGMSLAYSKDTPTVLKDLTCEINPKEKIGIVGRTGAGKSSLITSLFRLAEPVGVLQIDDIQTTELGLHDVRKNISIIPQDPVIFTGSLRRNLDPFGVYTDLSLWNALEDVQLHRRVRANPAKLDMEVGADFSVGERQLICLARAILKRNRVLILDEATANVDQATDALIQETIRQKFKNCTVLTIAHRLHTIMDSDRVMVLDAGKLIEMDHPFVLLSNRQTMFSMFVDQTGKKVASELYRTAQSHYEKTIAAKKQSPYGPLDSNCQYLYVVLQKSSEGYGFDLTGVNAGDSGTPIVVSEVSRGAPAYRQLQVEDEVLALNGKSRRDLTPDDVVKAFGTTTDVMTLIVRRKSQNPQDERPEEDTFPSTIQRNGAGPSGASASRPGTILGLDDDYDTAINTSQTIPLLRD